METYDGPLPSGIVLQEAASDVNTKVNSALQSARKSSGAKSPALEEAVYKLLGKPDYTSPHLAPIEAWANGLPEAKGKVPGKVYQPAAADSQYKDPITVLEVGTLAKVMLVAGIRIGVDKLGHFFQLGYTHYYRKTLGRGAPSRDNVVTEGDKSEAELFGVQGTGVYSFADLAANHAGLKFYEDLARSPDMTFDIHKYINQPWNEQSNPNLYGGLQSNLWLNNLEGAWTGTLTWTDGSTSQTAICNAKLKVNGARSYDELKNGIKNLEGTYQYLHPKASYTSGVLTGKIRNHKNADGAVDRVDLDVDWKEGGASGKGTLAMRSLSQMDGKWGRLGSADNGGTWTFRKT
jgi:hypothetical protein